MNRDSFTKWLQSSKEKMQSLRREKSAKNVSENSEKQKKQLSPRAKTVLTVLGSILAVCLCTVLIVGLAMGIYIAVYTYGEPQIDLEEYKDNQNQTTIIYAYDKNDKNKPVEIARLHGEENRIWVDAEDMPKAMLDAAVAIEDKRFYKHHGVDWFRIASSLFKHGMSQGGSTITQQLIKNLTDNKEVTINRKFNEMLYALNLERHNEKTDILEAYLNTIYLGEGCYGVQTAAEKYFGKDVSELNAAECATLVSITQKPTKNDPLLNPKENKVRQEYCLKVMWDEMGTLTESEYNEAKNYQLVFTNSENYVPKNKTKKESDKKEDDIYSYYVEYVIDEVCKDLQAEYGWTSSQAMEKINYGGLQIYTAVDLNVQASMEDVLENRKTFPKEKDTKERPAVQAAMTVMTYDGRVVGIVGGAGKKTQNRVLNRAANSPRQPGSSIKPLSIYAPAIEYNQVNWSTLIPNAPIWVQGKQWPMNYGQKIGGGELVTVQNALARSLNTIPARILQDMKFDKSFYFLKDKFHFTTLTEFGGKTDRNYAPLATGAMSKGMTTLEMAAAYASFGNGGYYYEPYCYYKVTDSKGEKVLLEHKDQAGERIMAADTADVMCELLQSVTTFEAGTTKNYRVNGFQTMAKTGTTTDEKDRWFAAGTPYYISATWYGYDIPREINNVSGNPAGKIFKAVFDKCHKGLAAKSFPKSGIAVEKTFCTKTGMLASPNCTSTQTGWYRINGVPGVCDKCAVQAPATDVGGQISEAVSGVVGAIGDVISNITGNDQ